MKIKSLLILLGFFLIVLNTQIFSQDYSLDYGIIGASGIVGETTDYKMVDLVSEIGMSQELQTSLNYSIIPVVGLEDETSSVSDWMLY